MLLLKVKSSTFIDALKFELTANSGNRFLGVLKDDNGSVCSTMEKTMPGEHSEFTWAGLNDLPYGKYTLELSQGEDFVKMALVKRV